MTRGRVTDRVTRGIGIAVVAACVALATGVVGHDGTSTSRDTAFAAVGRATAAVNYGDLPALVRTVQPTVVTVVTESGLGSGVVWSAEGVVVTNAHVVGDAKQVALVFADGKRVPATVQATDELTDLAIVKATRSGLTPANFETKLPALGSLAIAVGSPLGFTNSVTVGVVSGTYRSIPGSASETQSLVNLIQTDAAVSPGNSGGALVNDVGDVVGIVAAYIPPSAGAVALGFAIPANTVVKIVNELLKNGEAKHSYLGLVPAELTKQLQSQLDLDVDQGVVVLDVVNRGPADDAGIEPGDVIVSVDNKPVSTPEDLVAAVRDHDPGDKLSITLVRDGAKKTVTATLGDLEDATS